MKTIFDPANKTEIIERIKALDQCRVMHPFFGKLSHQQGGYLVYKHTDHHLRQFNG